MTLTRERLRDWGARLAPRSGLLVFGMSILITFVFWSLLPDSVRVNDSSDYTLLYEPMARTLLAGGGFVDAHGEIAARVPPGYPLNLALILLGSRVLGLPEAAAVSGFLILCSALTSLLIYVLSRQCWGAGPAWISALAWITCPWALWLTKQPNSEVPFLTALYGSVVLLGRALLARERKAALLFLAGLLAGYAMLIRPLAIGLGIVLASCVALLAGAASRARRLGLIVALIAGNVTAVLPWEAWAYVKTHTIIPLSSGDVPTLSDGLTFGLAEGQHRPRTVVPPDVEDLMRALRARRPELRSYWNIVSVLWEESRARPLALMKLIAIKALRSWYGTDSERHEDWIVLIQIPYALAIFVGGRRVWRMGRTGKKLMICGGLIVGYFWAMSMLVVPLLRYTMPTFGVLFLLLPALRRFDAPRSRVPPAEFAAGTRLW